MRAFGVGKTERLIGRIHSWLGAAEEDVRIFNAGLSRLSQDIAPATSEAEIAHRLSMVQATLATVVGQRLQEAANLQSIHQGEDTPKEEMPPFSVLLPSSESRDSSLRRHIKEVDMRSPGTISSRGLVLRAISSLINYEHEPEPIERVDYKVIREEPMDGGPGKVLGITFFRPEAIIDMPWQFERTFQFGPDLAGALAEYALAATNTVTPSPQIPSVSSRS